MKTAARHSLLPFLVALTFALGLSCSPRALAAGDLDCRLEFRCQ